MHRRPLLRKAGVALAAMGAAGCLQRGPAARQGGGDGAGTDGSATGTDTRSATPTAEPTHTAEHPSETPVEGTDARTDDTETPSATETPDHTETATPRGTTETPDDTETATPREVSRPRLVETAFEVRSVGPGNQGHEATVGTDGSTVVVEGKIPGANGCHTAELAAADHEDRRLTVLVRSYEDADDDTACTQSIVEIDYRADLAFEGALPETVQVDHEAMGDRTTVTTASVG